MLSTTLVDVVNQVGPVLLSFLTDVDAVALACSSVVLLSDGGRWLCLRDHVPYCRLPIRWKCTSVCNAYGLEKLPLGIQTLELSDTKGPNRFIRTKQFFKNRLRPGDLPQGLKSLKVGYHKHQLYPGDIPAEVTHLDLGSWYNWPLSEGVIPPGVKDLTLGWKFNQPLRPGDIPQGVTQLTLGFQFNQPLHPGDLPFSLKRLTFGYSFEKQLSPRDIPGEVTHLELGDLFNWPLSDGVIPLGVKELTFGCAFNQPLRSGDIPQGVTRLTFGASFNQRLHPGDVPKGVTHLSFGPDFDQPLSEGVIPAGVTHLTLRSLARDIHARQPHYGCNSNHVLPAHYIWTNGAFQSGVTHYIPRSVTHLATALDYQSLYCADRTQLQSTVSHLDSPTV